MLGKDSDEEEPFTEKEGKEPISTENELYTTYLLLYIHGEIKTSHHSH